MAQGLFGTGWQLLGCTVGLLAKGFRNHWGWCDGRRGLEVESGRPLQGYTA